MNRSRSTLLVATLLSGLFSLPAGVWARSAPEPADTAAPKRDQSGEIQAQFRMRHEAFLRRGKEGPIGVLFLGDSITERWSTAPKVWAAHYGKYQGANFGIGGDRTQHVLWRIENGELDGIHPKVVVLMIGSNNIGSPAEEIVRGDKKIVEEIHRKLPEAKLLLLAIFPRGAHPKDPNVARIRSRLAAVNAELAKLEDGGRTRYLDIGPKLLDAEGNLSPNIMPDGVHPSPRGYEVWAEAMQPLLVEMMR